MEVGLLLVCFERKRGERGIGGEKGVGLIIGCRYKVRDAKSDAEQRSSVPHGDRVGGGRAAHRQGRQVSS